MLLIVNTVLPVLVIVTYCDALATPTSVAPNLRLVGVRVTGPVAAEPVPLSAMLCGEPLALSVIVTVAVCAPETVG